LHYTYLLINYTIVVGPSKYLLLTMRWHPMQ